MSTSWIDPRDLRCKSPFGAVPCGAAVTFCFRPERGAAITRCELLAHGEFADRWTTLELAPVFEDGGTVYRGVFTAPDDIELVWYHFRLLWADGGTSCCGKAGLCAWDAMDVGIAIGSSAAAAADARVDNRVMFSVGRAARSLGLLGASVTLVLGIPLSVSGKSPFFDRKPKK